MKTTKCSDCINLIDSKCRSCKKKHTTCQDCGGKVSSKNVHQCKACYLSKVVNTCVDCNVRIYWKSTRCVKCSAKKVWSDPMWAAMQIAKLKNAKKLGSIKQPSLETKYLDVFANYGFLWQTEVIGYYPDFCNKLYKIIVEIFDNYWNCNPKIYQADFYHPELKVTALELWEKDKKRIEAFTTAGYQVHVIWEDELNSKQSFVNDFLESLNLKSNLLPEYKGMKTEDVVKVLDTKKFQYATMMEHWRGDFNFSGMCRNANAFGAKEVFYVGKRKWNKSGAVGTQYYTQVRYLQNWEQVEKLKERYVFVGIDNIKGSVSMNTFNFPINSLFIFGEENAGLTEKMISLCDHIVEIPMFGSVRSLNAACTSGIVLHEYCQRLQTS